MMRQLKTLTGRANARLLLYKDAEKTHMSPNNLYS